MNTESTRRDGEFAFLPSTWFDIKPGDRVVSLSGTIRTVLDISQTKGRLAVAFRTQRLNGDVELETAHVDPRSTQGIKEVLRRDTEFPPAPSATAPQTPSLSVSPANVVRPRSWHDVRPGDVVVSHSGSRRLITSMQTDDGEPAFDCLMRAPEGLIERAYLQTSPATIDGVKEIQRTSLPVPTMQAGGALKSSLVETIEIFLGRGTIGDNFTETLFRNSDMTAAGAQSVAIKGMLDLNAATFERFIGSRAPEAVIAPVSIEVYMPADFSKPLSVADLKFSSGVPYPLAQELIIAAVLSNALKGVHPR